MKTFYGDHMDLLCRKGFYPYEYIDSHDKLNHIGLPSKEFIQVLVKSQLVMMNMNMLKMCIRNLVVKVLMITIKHTCNVMSFLLLADIFENFRNIFQQYYDLDPANYITLPGAAWDAMLKMTGIDLELISDQKVLDIIDWQKRGGLCFVGSKRHVVANNKHMGDDYDQTKESNYLTYLDANNLYGWAMSRHLPFSKIGFDEKVTIKEVLETADDNIVGYIVECDLSFPKELHDKFKEYPPCPENIVPKDTWMSDYQLDLRKKLNIKSKSPKLVAHLMPHERYCIHYRNLKYVKSLGVEIGEVHNII